MSDPVVKTVKLSGVAVGYAATWKEAEAIVEKVLRARGRKPREWDGDSTMETYGSLLFFMGDR